MTSLLLASRSPRRRELLALLGVRFESIDADVDERQFPGEDARDYVRRLARAKAAAGHSRDASALPVLAADTTVVVEGEVLGKPEDEADARRMLMKLSGRWHEVHSGIALLGRRGHCVCVTTRVCFRPLHEHEIARYWASGEPADKAGAYGIQGLGGVFVTRIDGSYSNVVGLPLAETVALLDAERVPHALSWPL